MDEVLLCAALIHEYGRGDSRRREAAELEVQCPGRKPDELPAALLDTLRIRERGEVGGAQPEGAVLFHDLERLAVEMHGQVAQIALLTFEPHPPSCVHVFQSSARF